MAKVVRRKFDNKKGSYFFVIDAFVAGGILVLTITMLLSFFASKKPDKQVLTFLNDYSLFLQENSVLDFPNPVVTNLSKAGVINDRDLSLSKQILLLVYQNQTGTCILNTDNYCFEAAKNLTRATLISLPEELGVRVNLKNQTTTLKLYETNQDIENHSNSKLVKSIIEYLFINSTTFYGPVSLEVEMWS